MNLVAGLFDAYPKASSTKMIAGLFNAYSLLEIGTYKPSSVKLGSSEATLQNVSYGTRGRAERPLKVT